MSTFEGVVLTQTIAVAKQYSIEPAALLSVVEVESAGKSLEQDGKTPCLLFERHIFYKEIVKKFGKSSAQLRNAQTLGLANAVWEPPTKNGVRNPNSQYRDQGRSADRLALFQKACTVDKECAIRSCSWGVGQTMGFLAEELKFKNAIQMFDFQVSGGVPAQVDCMVREIARKRLIPKLNTHNWDGFALSYNGPSYKTMRYDVKMATAYAKWAGTKLPDAGPVIKPVVPADTKPADQTKIPPQAPEITKSSGGFLAAIMAFFAGAAAFVHGHRAELIGIAVMVGVLGAITYFTLKRRREQATIAPQIGVLAEVAEPEAA